MQGKKPVVAEDIGAAQVQLNHLDPALFLQVKSVTTHTHTGQDSQQLNGAVSIVPLSISSNQVNATVATILNAGPSKIQSYLIGFGSAINSGAIGSVVVTFGVAFNSVPAIALGGRGADSNEQKVIYSYYNLSSSQVTLYAYNASAIQIAAPACQIILIGT